MIIHPKTENEFNELIKEEKVLVDFYADWCGPCKMLAPILEQLDEKANIKILKVNVDDLPLVARRYAVMSIPTLLVFENGEKIKQQMGYMPLNHLIDFIK